jgi:hypothetical protein
MTSTLRASLIVLSVASGLAAAIGCSTADSSARTRPRGPDRTQFTAVARVLVRQCGSLDCHGVSTRNLRLYGYGGLRLPSSGVLPDEGDIRPEEVDADYDAVVGVEPEKMTEVAAARGAGAEDLTFVRKGRGVEDHKGKAAVTAGDDADRCILSWLASAVDLGACTRVAPPRGDAGATDGG